MESQVITENKIQISANNDFLDSLNEKQMTSSILSATSSLMSPVDSGVQLLDSESDITSVMSMSGTTYDLESSYDTSGTEIKTIMKKKITPNAVTGNSKSDYSKQGIFKYESEGISDPNIQNIMTKSDIANQNTTLPFNAIYSSSAPNVEYKLNYKETSVKSNENWHDNRNSKIDLELSTNVDIKPDTDEKSIILPKHTDDDKTTIPKMTENIMHISASEEVNETLIGESKTETQKNESSAFPPADEQIVFRRQRKKKSSKSDTPKKRVSFHEDILNSTKIDDIHINHGFITHQPDISMSFFNWDSIRKPDVVKGRYSWAAEGDTPYYERNMPEREVKSEIYMKSRYSTSSSSTGSVDSSSSNSLCDNEQSSEGGIHTPSQKLPRSSCLKKRTSTKRIDTHIVQEEPKGSLKHRKSESNLLDSNIFGSLKNILSFSTSVPLAERGVPEGQEDIGVYSCGKNSSTPKRRSFSLNSENTPYIEIENDQLNKQKVTDNLNIEISKKKLQLAPSEGFYPINMNLPSNIVICDSNVYEHKGISYSYEYDKFQKSLENPKTQNQKSSTVYQMLLQDLNFFKRKEKEKSENNLKALSELPTVATPTPKEKINPIKKFSRSSITDWSSDTETTTDTENISKHLSSPKHKINKANHYTVQNLKSDVSETKFDCEIQKLPSIRSSTSKTSLINRFLRNVTIKKLLDVKLQKKHKIRTNKYMTTYIKGLIPDEDICSDLDKELEEEIALGQKSKILIEKLLGSSIKIKLQKEVFRDCQEKVINFYKVHNAYSFDGDSKPLIIFFTNTTLYITGLKPNQSFYNLFVLPYSELNTILIGPNGHTIHFANTDREMQFIITTGCLDISNDLVGQLEMIIRKNSYNQILPAVRYLTMREMVQLNHAVCSQTSVDKEEEYFYYSIVNIQDASIEPDLTPLGPTKKGPLMFKTANDIRWETGYFILKGGVLYILSSPSNRLPLRAIPLSNGSCLGAHRTPYCVRPHTFELLLGNMVLQLAAPDEYVASEWLQVLIQSASGLYNNEVNRTQKCTLLLTSQHILTMREKFPGNTNTDFKAQALSCANISDLISFKIPLVEQSWCILEFACREVHETSGDLIIYFATNLELERFISSLEMLWTYNNIKGDSFPLNPIPENEFISKRCGDVYQTLQQAWSSVNLL